MTNVYKKCLEEKSNIFKLLKYYHVKIDDYIWIYNNYILIKTVFYNKQLIKNIFFNLLSSGKA